MKTRIMILIGAIAMVACASHRPRPEYCNTEHRWDDAHFTDECLEEAK